jgi:hypothetical protein
LHQDNFILFKWVRVVLEFHTVKTFMVLMEQTRFSLLAAHRPLHYLMLRVAAVVQLQAKLLLDIQDILDELVAQVAVVLCRGHAALVVLVVLQLQDKVLMVDKVLGVDQVANEFLLVEVVVLVPLE